MIMRSGRNYILPTGATLAVALAAAPSFAAITDGFGDGDRNNNGAITAYDVDTDLSGVIDGAEPAVALDAGDTGIVWAATRGFTSSNTGDPKANIKIIDDSVGDIDSPGLQSGYALASEAKGSGSSFAGFFDNSVQLGANVGDRVDFSFDIRGWSQSNNATPFPAISELRIGLFQDSDGQFGQANNEGLDSGAGQASVIWGPDTGENDGSWRDANPGPIGDKGYWLRLPMGVASDPLAGRLIYENNTSRFLEGSSVGNGGDQDTVADPNNANDGPGGAITNPMIGHNVQLSAVRTATSIELEAYLNGVLIMADEIDPADPDVVILGTPHDSFDYVAFRNTGTFGDFDFIIDNVSVNAVAIPEPASLALMGLGGLTLFSRRRG
jgi:PEP-CTERM motif